MEAILNSDFDIDNPFISCRGDYYAKVTRFLSGGVEVVMKAVRPMAMEKRAEQFANCFPVSNRPPVEKSESEIAAEKAANHRRAVRKAKQTTRFLCQQMCADRILTLTYRQNMEDREQVKADFKRFIRLVRASRNVDFQYVAVLERQERGAYHVHVAVRGWQPITLLRRCWYKALGAAPDAAGEDTPGQVNITSPRNFKGSGRKRQWATDRLASYIVKYMNKTFDESTTEKNRYWRSRDIVPPVSRRHWLVATNLADAINELMSHLSFSEGMELKKHWLSDDGTVYWCRGVCS